MGSVVRRAKDHIGAYTAEPLSPGPALPAEIQTSNEFVGTGCRAVVQTRNKKNEEMEDSSQGLSLLPFLLSVHPSGLRHPADAVGRRQQASLHALATFWEEILCFWCMWGRIWSSPADSMSAAVWWLEKKAGVILGHMHRWFMLQS